MCYLKSMLNTPPCIRVAIVVTAAWLAIGCGDGATAPSTASNVTIGAPTPAPGSVVRASGIFIERGSGQLSIPITLQSGRDVPYAQLSVYLLTADGSYCGQNIPDAPTWGGLEEGQHVSVTISGFQVFRLPCQVTGIRAMLHQRNNGLLIPPNASETIAEATLTASYTIQ